MIQFFSKHLICGKTFVSSLAYLNDGLALWKDELDRISYISVGVPGIVCSSHPSKKCSRFGTRVFFSEVYRIHATFTHSSQLPQLHSCQISRIASLNFYYHHPYCVLLAYNFQHLFINVAV